MNWLVLKRLVRSAIFAAGVALLALPALGLENSAPFGFWGWLDKHPETLVRLKGCERNPSPLSI